MGVYGTENFQTLLFLQFSMDSIQINSATTLGNPSQNLLNRILNFGFFDFLKNFKIFEYIEVYGSWNLQTLLLLQLCMDQVQFFSATALGGPS